MKRSIMTLTVMLAAVALIAVFSSPAAAITGACGNCHTMHYSQGGTPLSTGGPYAKLVINDCMGCHTTPSSGVPFDGATPFVAGLGLTDDACLAGGFFPGAVGDNHDDDHHGIGNNSVPAGYDQEGTFVYVETNGLSCAGKNGCHGVDTIDTEDDMTALGGGHHNTSLTYRMLYVDGKAVDGSGAPDYEVEMIDDPSTIPITSGSGQNVNIYCAGAASSGEVTISEFCAKCHGNFHDEVGDGTDTGTAALGWTRHPTENVVTATWEIVTGGLDGNDYKFNPVGYDTANIDDPDGMRVTCLSCHRAHGTQNQDILRFGYAEGDTAKGQTQVAGSNNAFGCLGCHNAQRGS